jgi:hypothetical protein
MIGHIHSGLDKTTAARPGGDQAITRLGVPRSEERRSSSLALCPVHTSGHRPLMSTGLAVLKLILMRLATNPLAVLAWLNSLNCCEFSPGFTQKPPAPRSVKLYRDAVASPGHFTHSIDWVKVDLPANGHTYTQTVISDVALVGCTQRCLRLAEYRKTVPLTALIAVQFLSAGGDQRSKYDIWNSVPRKQG